MDEYAVVLAVVTEIVEEKPPQLFDLTGLQKEANSRYGLSAKETLKCAQSLYEDGNLSYPRTSSHSITPDMVQSVTALLSGPEGTDTGGVRTSNAESSTSLGTQMSSVTNTTPEGMGRTIDNSSNVIESDSEEPIKNDEKVTYAGFDKLNDRINEIGRDVSLSNKEKVAAIKNAYYNTINRKDINVPVDEKYIKGFDASGRVIYDWPPKLGFKEESIRPITKEFPLPKGWDRYGYMGGANFASVPENDPYSYSERAIPYVENPDAYHKGIFNNESYFEKIDAIRNGNIDSLNSILKSEGIDTVDEKYFSGLQDQYDDYLDEAKESIGEDCNAPYGLQGEAASWKDLSGGASQFVTPFNGNVLSRLGICKEDL